MVVSSANADTFGSQVALANEAFGFLAPM